MIQYETSLIKKEDSTSDSVSSMPGFDLIIGSV